MSDKDEITKGESWVPTHTGDRTGCTTAGVTLCDYPADYSPHGDKRVIIQIAVSECPESDTVVALCNDGTVWRSIYPHEKWIKMREIPQGEEE